MSDVKSPRHAKHFHLFLVGAVAVWLPLVVTKYLAYPLYALLTLLLLLVWAGCWLLAVGSSVAAVVVLLRRRAYGWAAGALVVALGLGLVVDSTDWERTYIDTQFRLHRNQLADVAADYRAGSLAQDAALPWGLRHLSHDGRVRASEGVLYLPLWQDWRAESGLGLAYFPSAPARVVDTAAGDQGKPLRHLGDGWWYIA